MLRKFETINTAKLVIFAILPDLLAMFVLWPYFGQGYPTAPMAVLLILSNVAVVLLAIGFSRKKR